MIKLWIFLIFIFQTLLHKLMVKRLISPEGTSSQQCFRYNEQINSIKASISCKLQKMCEEKLKAEMERGEENQLFRICEEANISPNQLKMLGYKHTFAQLPQESSKSEVQRAKEGHVKETVPKSSRAPWS